MFHWFSEASYGVHGRPVEEDELIAVSGVGLCFPWKVGSSCDEVSVIPEIPTRTFDALGYESEYLSGESGASPI